jgi:hypothetical protein
MSIEAMKQALEALDTCHWDYDSEGESYKTFDEDLVNDASEALRQAIEQAEKQEPKAWIYEGNLHIFDPTDWAIEPESVQPLYAAPSRKEWVGLTDEEIKNILDCGRGGLVDIKKAEQILKEKNNG